MSNNTQFQGSSDVSLSPGQAKFLYWFVGTAPILKAMTPITTYRGNYKTALKTLQKTNPLATKLGEAELRKIYTSVVSDFARQTITCSFQLMSYFVVGDAIKAILKKVYSKKPAQQQDLGLQQVLMQAIPLSVQVIATILSRNFGAAEIQSLFDVDPKTGHYVIPPNESGMQLKLKQKAKVFIENTLTDSKTKCLQPLKASVIATGAMMGYFATLVGVLYGVSTGLEKAFPGTFKRQGKGKPDDAPANPTQKPTGLDLNSPAANLPTTPPAAQHPISPLVRPALNFTAHRSPVLPMTYSH